MYVRLLRYKNNCSVLVFFFFLRKIWICWKKTIIDIYGLRKKKMEIKMILNYDTSKTTKL